VHFLLVKGCLILTRAEIDTVAQLTEIPLSEFTCFRGFKRMCMRELTTFIEFEQLQDYFIKSKLI